MMACDQDTICVSVQSYEWWAQKAAMPEARAHFDRVASGLNNKEKPAPARLMTGDIGKYDMTRAASELGY
jgi:hypothetical protein